MPSALSPPALALPTTQLVLCIAHASFQISSLGLDMFDSYFCLFPDGCAGCCRWTLKAQGTSLESGHTSSHPSTADRVSPLMLYHTQAAL